jgi:TonB family protein
MSKRNLISFCAASCSVLLAAGWLALHTFPLQAAPVPQEAAQSKLLHSVPPQYPAEAREKHIEGVVVLEVQIDAEGHVSDAKVLSGPQELRNAALTAVLQWHYSPTAMTLPTTTEVTMEFKLPKNGEPVTTTHGLPPVGPPFTLKRIEIEGLSDTARDELLRRLPVHVGDTIDADAVQSVAQAVRAFDDHLVVFTRPADGALRIFIAPPAPASAPARIRVGRNVQQAKLLVKVQPVYPPAAKAQGIEGMVVLQAIVGKDGKVENLVVLSGDPALAAAALEAVRQWQYQTTLLNGDPVEVVTEIQVNFTLAK